ncbi:uncharacterized protein KZ484_010411 isoform 1-T1 [Pholidichthys leucotaenia]
MKLLFAHCSLPRLMLIQISFNVPGFSKKLVAASSERGCMELRAWSKSVVNHMYWSAMSSPQGQGDLVLAKWLSIVPHCMDIHVGHGTLFPTCEHGELQGKDRCKKWVKPSTKAAIKLECLVHNPSLCRDIKKLSGSYQTSQIEAFHSLVTQFAPKMYGFSYLGMLCRTRLAAMHYIENAARGQATTRDGRGMFSLHFPEYKKGAPVVKKIMQNATFAYVDQLMAEVKELCSTPVDEREPDIQIPSSLCAGFHHPCKQEAIKEHRSRFPQR